MSKKRILTKQAEKQLDSDKKTPDLKENLNAWLDTNVNQPLAKRGYETAGAGLSALGSAAGEMYIPEDATDVAMSLFPAGKAAKMFGKLFGSKGSKAAKEVTKKVDDTAESHTPEQSLTKFKDLTQPEPPKKELIGEMTKPQLNKEIRDTKKVVKDSKTRRDHETLQKDIEADILKTDRRDYIHASSPQSKTINYANLNKKK